MKRDIRTCSEQTHGHSRNNRIAVQVHRTGTQVMPRLGLPEHRPCHRVCVVVGVRVNKPRADHQAVGVERRARGTHKRTSQSCSNPLKVRVGPLCGAPLTPSAQRTLINKQAQFKRCSGWEGR